jgi:hypothetical protein
MSIPVERRELGDGWVLTCRGESGGDLTLSDVIIKRENLCCQVLGGETMFFPMFGQDTTDTESAVSGISSSVNGGKDNTVVETSILDHIRDILEQAQREGYWQAGVGGVEKVRTQTVECLASSMNRHNCSSRRRYSCRSHRLIDMWHFYWEACL